MEQKSYSGLVTSNIIFVFLSAAVLFFQGAFFVGEALIIVLMVVAPILTILNFRALRKNPKNKSVIIGFTVLTSIATMVAIYGAIFAMFAFRSTTPIY